jgi:hypothetical protein
MLVAGEFGSKGESVGRVSQRMQKSPSLSTSVFLRTSTTTAIRTSSRSLATTSCTVAMLASPAFGCEHEAVSNAQGELPLDDVDQVVQLQEVDVVDAQPIERELELLLRSRVVPLTRLGGDEERFRMLLSQEAIRSSESP